MPILGSKLIAMASTCLWSSLRWCSAFCGHTEQESTLVVHPEKMVSGLFGRSRVFPGLPPSYLWHSSLLQAVFMQPSPFLSLGSYLWSPSPHPAWWVSREHLSLVSASQHWSSVQESLHFTLCPTVAALSSVTLELPSLPPPFPTS